MMNRHYSLAFVLAFLAHHLAAAEPAAVGSRACLFLDDRFIAKQTGFLRTWHQGKPAAQPAIAPDKPWERWPHLFGSVLFDPLSKRYKMWYEDIPDQGAVFYAESLDGKTWTKPKLGQYELKGSRDNNCVLYPAELPNVFLDPNEKDPQARFKMLAWCNQVAVEDRKVSGLIVFSSGDGIRWKHAGSFPLSATTDKGNPRTVRDTNEVIWDELGERYLGTFRTFPLHPGLPGWFRDEKHKMTPGIGGHRRGVGVATSKQLRKGWPAIVTVLQADAKDDEKVKRLSRGPELDWAELYIMPMFVYGNHYLGAVSLLFHVDGMNDTVAGGGDLQLTFSHDGLKWFRQPDRQTLTAPSPSKLVPCYAACNAPLELGDELWLYYTEATSAHPGADHKANIRAAVWRKDGFVSLDAAKEGTMTTPPLKWEGNRLLLNFETETGGAVRAALLGADDKPLQGFALEDCDPLTGNAAAKAVTWRDQSGLAALKSAGVRLRIEVEKGRLWSFRFAP